MRLKSMFVAAVAVGLSGGSAMAQAGAQGAAHNSAQGEAQYAADLRTMITQTASGVCPADIMAEQLLAACQQQLPQMSAGLSSLGGVQSITFAKADETPEGRVETYKVVFANGVTLNWGIGHKKAKRTLLLDGLRAVRLALKKPKTKPDDGLDLIPDQLVVGPARLIEREIRVNEAGDVVLEVERIIRGEIGEAAGR